MIVYGPDGIEALGAAIAARLRGGDTIGLSGALGSGKTTLARAMLRHLGLAGEAPSPTYAIVQPYDPPEVALAVLHVDLYRIVDPMEIVELGLFDQPGDPALVIEWPERMGAALPNDALRLTIAPVDGGTRRALTATVPPAWDARWPPR